jgi:hypothetical protein
LLLFVNEEGEAQYQSYTGKDGALQISIKQCLHGVKYMIRKQKYLFTITVVWN